MREFRFVVFALLLAALPRPTAAGQWSPTKQPDTVVVASGTLRLHGLLWRPVGIRPFPAILFSHGSGLRVDSVLARDRADALGPIFAKHGYVFLYLFRRGYGLSASQGESMGAVLDREAQAHGEEARKRLQLVLLTHDHLDDVMAGLSFLKRVGGVDSTRIGLVGHSFGGQLTLLAAERDKSIRAAITFAAAAQSWEGSSELRQRLLVSAQNISAPVFLAHAANDYSILPGQAIASELARLGRIHELKIYPAVGRSAAAGHEAVYTDTATWEADVFRFLDVHVRRR